MVTSLPPSGSLLVRSAVPPDVPGTALVDVRPGAAAFVDGGRPVATLRVQADGPARRFDTASLSALGDAVATRLDDEPADAIRFGDPALLRRGLPDASVTAIRRCLASAAAGEGATFLAWTAETPRAADRRAYDVVLD